MCQVLSFPSSHLISTITVQGIFLYPHGETEVEMLSDLLKVIKPEIWKKLLCLFFKS